MALYDQYGTGPSLGRVPNAGLQEILMRFLGPQMAPPAAIPGAAPAPASPLDAQIAEQNRILSEPQPYQDLPVPKEPTTLLKILAGLADAAGTYAGGLNPYVGPPGASNMLAEQGRSRQEAIRANAAARMGGDYNKRQALAERTLRELMGKRDIEAKAAEKASDRAYAAGLVTTANEREDKKERERREQDIADATTAFERQQALQAARDANDRAVAQIQAGIRNKDRVAETEAENLNKGRAYVVALAEQVPIMLAGGRPKDPRDPDSEAIPAQTADQIRTRIRRAFDVIMGPSGAARDAADAYVQMEIEPIIHDYLQGEGQGPIGKAAPPGPRDLPPESRPLRGFAGR